MPETHSNQIKGIDATSWRSLRAFSAYRVFLASVFFGVPYFGLPPEFLGELNPQLYLKTSQFYLGIAIFLLLLSLKSWVTFANQVKLQLTVDIVIITLLIHTSGGLSTGLGSLLVVVVVSGGALIPGRIAVFFAALATIAVLTETAYSQVFELAETKYSYAGLLGATFFATTILTQILSQKIISSQSLADQRAEDLANLALLNNHIISRMLTGVIVVDDAGKIQLCNESARHLLGIDSSYRRQTLKYWVPILGIQLEAWKNDNNYVFTAFHARHDLPEISVNASLLESGETVLYINNSSDIAKQAQQMKLASLGQLTASIAHEVRNPLGAISHAGELLAELNHNNQETVKLTQIIERHSQRVNSIIETILEMSRGKPVEATTIVLNTWFEQFVTEFCHSHAIPSGDIIFHSDVDNAQAYMDPGQLYQIVNNLIENAWYYSKDDEQQSRVSILLTLLEGNVIVDVVDNGPGVSPLIQDKLFEPFQSQRPGGTGLGLYLARELCQANGINLSYLPDMKNGSCFRINFYTGIGDKLT